MRFLDLNQYRNQPHTQYQVLDCCTEGDRTIVAPLPAGSHSIAVSPRGRYACVWSDTSMQIVRLPYDKIELDDVNDSRRIRCTTFSLAKFYTRNPDHSALKIRWHPASERHLVVLSCDNQLRIYDVEGNPEVPEQDFDLKALLSPSLRSSTPTTTFSSFSFGPPRGWDEFTIYLLTSTGGICCLCPVVPHGCPLSRSTITSLLSQEPLTTSMASEWLQSTLESSHHSQEVLSFPASLSSQMSAVLQGPVHEDAKSEACDIISISSSLAPTCLIRSFAEGFVDVMVALETAVPRFEGERSKPSFDDNAMFLWDRIDLREQQQKYCRLFLNPCDPNVVIVQGANSQVVRMGWLSDMRAWCKKPEARDREKTFDAILAIPTECKTINYNSSNALVVGFQPLSDFLLGSYCVCIRKGQGCSVAQTPKFVANINQIASAPPDPAPEDGWNAIIAKFLESYRGFRVDNPVRGPIDLQSTDSCQEFLQLRKEVYHPVFESLQELQSEVNVFHRITES